ncbi:MAG: DUF3343 domain-containing protein [Clostridia bacterium]|nr:DUF3343 domain-containing protein [Clostridia bacterium]
MTERHGGCSAEIGSVTQAMRVQDALASAAIPSKIIKSQSSSRHGCIYGVSFSCSQERNVRAILEASRIPVRHWNTGENL